MLRLNSSDIWILESVLRAGSCIFEFLDFLSVLPHAFTGPRFLSLRSRSHSLAVSLEFILTLSQRALFVFSLSAGPPLFYLPHVSPSLLVLLTLPLPLSSSPSYSVFLVFMSASRIQVSLGIFKFRIFYICFSIIVCSAILFLIFHVLSICTVVFPFCASCLLLFLHFFLLLHHSFPSILFSTLLSIFIVNVYVKKIERGRKIFENLPQLSLYTTL